MRELTVLLVEDDPAACGAFAAYADTLDDVRIVCVTGEADKALKALKDHLPDALILDLELHRGSGSGLDVLRGLKELSANPYVLVTTNNTSAVTYEYARKLGADYIFSKHQSGYSEREALDFLRLMADEIRSKSRSPQEAAYTPESPAQRGRRIRQRLSAELNQIGINPRSKGYQYLTEAVLQIMEGRRDGVFRAVAEKFGKSLPSVERASQNAINQAWALGDIDVLAERYCARVNPAKGAPTITEFVHYYANLLENEYS